MSCKYDIIEDGGRKRVRALRPFTVQGRDVCPMELGGYVYDANTLSQDGNCWIFSGSLEYPGVRVMDEAIVDMGNNIQKSYARPKNTIIAGNSRIMGAISFETQSPNVLQTPSRFEQGGYSVVVGSTPVKADATNRVRIPAQLFAGTVGKVAITSTAYEARLISLNEAGIVTAATAWTVGGPAVTLDTTAPYILLDLRKVGETAITPADVTAAGITITQAREATVHIFNSSIVPVYNGSVTNAPNVFRLLVSGATNAATSASFQNSYLRAECTFNGGNGFLVNADFIKVNYNLVLTPGALHYVSGVFRNTNMNTPASVDTPVARKGMFDVTDCPAFEYSKVVFPDLAAMYAANKTFYFKQCNMPAGSAIHYYDPKVNVWDNIDFTKAMADLGKLLPGSATLLLVSSDKQGLYRVCSSASNTFGMLVEKFSSVSGWVRNVISGSYDSIIYQDCTLTGKIHISGRNVFGGTLGGASKITNTSETMMEIDGNFRIEGNAQVTDTPLKGNGYIGGNAELKNGNVEGYIYMAENAKFIPGAVANRPVFRNLIMTGNSQLLKLRNDIASVSLKMSGNSIINGTLSVSGEVELRDNAIIDSTASPAIEVLGKLLMTEKSRISGAAKLNAFGNITLVGTCTFSGSSAANFTRHGKLILATSDTPDVLPPTKITW